MMSWVLTSRPPLGPAAARRLLRCGPLPFDGVAAGAAAGRRSSDECGRVVPFDEPTYDASPGRNAAFDTTKLRYEYTSLVTPNSTFDIDVASGERKLLKEKPVRNYDRTKYDSARVWATAKDGTKVPISLIFPKGLKKDGKSPLFLHGYGSYGYSYDAKFSSSSLSFVDRGWTVGIAHIRPPPDPDLDQEDDELAEARQVELDWAA